MKVTPDVCEMADLEFELVFGQFVHEIHEAPELRTYLEAEFLQGVAWGFENPAGKELVSLEAKLRASGEDTLNHRGNAYLFLQKTREASEHLFAYGAAWGISMARNKRTQQPNK